MRTLQFSFVISIWPIEFSADHYFDGETHRWSLQLGPVGFNVWFEPSRSDDIYDRPDERGSTPNRSY